MPAAWLPGRKVVQKVQEISWESVWESLEMGVILALPR